MEESLTGYAICFVFMITAFLAYLEDYIGKYKLPIYIGLCIILVIIASTRVIGFDPDSTNYENSFISIASGKSDMLVEYSFIILSQIIGTFTNDVHYLFFVYALLGVSLKFIAFRQLCESWFLPVLVYIGYFFIFHECMQIRTGVLSAMFLLSIKPWSDGNKLKAFLFIVIGFFFHYSALMLVPLLFLSNNNISFYGKIFWALLIPFAYVLYFGGFSIFLEISTGLPYIGEKLAMYQYAEQKGLSTLAVNVFSPLFIFTTLLYYYLLYFHDTLIEENKYYPLMIKLFGIAIFAYTALGTFPPLAQRVNLLLRIVSIILFANICQTIIPKWAGVSVAMLVAFVYLNYAVPSVNFHLFWDPGVFF